MTASSSKPRKPAKTTTTEPLNGHVVDSSRVLRLSTSTVADDRRTPLFYIDDQEYSIQVRPSAAAGLKYLDIVRRQGQEAGAAWMLEHLLGRDGYEALMNYDALTTEQLTQIVEIASETLMGSIEAPKA